jgi:cytochrome c-type biogenesis protein CcmH
MRLGWAIAGLVLSWQSHAVEVREFSSPEKRQTYESLVKDLRCLVCQNQSLADSDADLAKDLRDEVYRIIEGGKSKEEASQFLVDRYGDFVLYSPPFKFITGLLWGGPFALLLTGGVLLWRQAKRRNTEEKEPELTPDERQRLQKLKQKIEG